MKYINGSNGLMAIIFIVILTYCSDRESTNPYDPDCPKELFTPSDLKAEQENTSVILTWHQENTHITGFIINRSENDGSMSEVAKLQKSVTTWNDNNVTGGSKYKYELFAYAGKNESNAVSTSINPIFLAIVSTGSVSNVTNTTAQVQGNVTSDGGSNIVERGFCYATSPNPTIDSSKIIINGDIGIFNIEIAGLQANTKYYIRAYVTNSQGTSYGNETNFTTTAINLPIAYTSDADFITMNSAALHGFVNANGSNTAVIFEYGISTEYGDTIIIEGGLVTGSTNTFVTSIISGLTENTTYHYRVKATNQYGTTYGSDLMFTTKEKSTIPENGLVAWYPFNGNANDESGNGINGTVNGAVLTTDRFGNANRAYSFDGINNYVDLGNEEALNLGTQGSSYSIVLWFKTLGNEGPYQDNIVGKASTIESKPNPYNLLLGINNSVKFQVNSKDNQYNIFSPDTYGDNKWHFAVGIKDNNVLSLYIDGSLVAGPKSFSIPDVRSNAVTLIGSYTISAVSGELFNGQIDDVRVYNRTLSEEEVQALYHEGEWGN